MLNVASDTGFGDINFSGRTFSTITSAYSLASETSQLSKRSQHVSAQTFYNFSLEILSVPLS